MAYISVKKIRGRKYAYLQRSRRVGKRVRTQSKYLFPVGGKTVVAVGEAIKILNKPLDQIFAELDARDAARRADIPVVITGLPVGKEWTQEMFDREAMSQKSAAESDAASQSSSDPTGEQPSDQTSGSDQGTENSAE
jgi:hypothetical protein